MQVLVVNAGSSSLKLSVLGPEDELLSERVLVRPDGAPIGGLLAPALDAVPPVDAVGHRVVHGGSLFRHAVVLDATREDQLGKLADLAPLHNGPALDAIAAVTAWRPDLPQVACFDTEFHVDMPPEAATYALPATWRDDWGLRRFGFHGLSHAYATRRAAQLLGRPLDELRLVSAHLGSGASLAAVAAGRSVDTTMGFTPLEGLVMATRSGTVDPGLVLWVQRHQGLSVDEVEDALERRSGLLGLSGSADMRAVLAAADGGDEPARLALGVYVHRLRALVAGMVAALGALDGLVFTGGVGEGSARVRRDVSAGLGFLGITLDATSEDDPGADNGAARPDRLLSRPGVTPAVVVVHAREDLEIARLVRACLHPLG